MSVLYQLRTRAGVCYCGSFCSALMILAHLEAWAGTVSQNGKMVDGELPLPKWSEHEIRAFQGNPLVGSTTGVLPPGMGGPAVDINELLNAPVESGPRLDHLFDKSESIISPRLRPEDMALFLPESLLGHAYRKQADGPMPTPLSSLREVAPEFLTSSAMAMPKDYLIDPDLLVPEIQQQDMMRFLEFHARDARIKLYVLILAHDRRLPEGARLDKIASGALLQDEACLVVYPLGEPWRARLFVSKPVHDQASSIFLSETIQACLQEAMQASDAHDQMHRYAVHLSTRLFWLQRALAKGSKSSPTMGQPLAEISPAPSKLAVDSSKVSILRLMIACMTGLAVSGSAVAMGRWLFQQQRRRQQMRVWILPETETIPRLGGAFSGGGGGMIRYSSSSG